MLLVVEKIIIGEMYDDIYWYPKNKKKCLKDYGKNKELSCLKHWGVSILYGWAKLQKLPVNVFEWVEDISEFDKCFIKRFNEESNEGHLLEANVKYPKKFHDFKTWAMNYHFYLKELKL